MDNEKELQEAKKKIDCYKTICEDLMMENKELKEKIREYEMTETMTML